MRFIARSLAGVVLTAMTFALLALAVQQVVSAIAARDAAAVTGGPARERVFQASVITVTPDRIAPVMSAFGEVRAKRRLELRAPTGGTVLELAPGFADGARVAAGEVLMRLDPAEAEASRALAAAALDEAGAALREAERAVVLAGEDVAAARTQASLRDQALARQEDLLARGVGSAAAVEEAALAASGAGQSVVSRKQALASAEARVDQARAARDRAAITLAEAERTLGQTVLRAEFAGVLNGVTVVQGGLVGANERLGELIDPSALEVAIRLSTAQAGRLLGPDGALLPAEVRIGGEAGGAALAVGRLVRLGVAVGEGESGRLVLADLDAPGTLQPGDFVTVDIVEPALEAVALVPASAIDGAGRVMVLGPDDRLEAQPVEVLRRQGNQALIAASALAGREIVAELTPLLGAGIKLRPVRPADAAAGAAPEPKEVTLSPERRASLVAQVEANQWIPADVKARLLDQLAQEKVPAAVIRRLEERAGG
jgi:multidrug efflux pump subunit AcrA (membrane-fusion protein)